MPSPFTPPSIPASSLGSVLLVLTANQSVANAAAVDWSVGAGGAVEWDDLGFWSAAAPTVITCPSTGRYLVGHCTDIAGAGGTGTKSSQIDGTGVSDTLCGYTTTGQTNPLWSIEAPLLWTAGTTLRVRGFWASSPQSMSGNRDTRFWAIKIG